MVESMRVKLGGLAMNVVLVGTGGYGRFYVNRILDDPKLDIHLVGTVDPNPQGCDRFDDLCDAGVTHYHNLEDFYKNNSADIAIITTPIQLHADHILTALKNGSHVLSEKPLCSLIQQVPELIRMRNQTKKIVSIGYQWSFSRAIQALKADIMSGWYGQPLHLKSMVLWPRSIHYYTRNDWAGVIQDTRKRYVLDGPVNNAAAHFLHNMFYVLGKTVDTSAQPVEVCGEAYRANTIENYDTAFLRCRTAENATCMLFVSHAGRVRHEPKFEFVFEKGTVVMDEKSGEVKGFHKDGSIRTYGVPEADGERKLTVTLDAIRQGDLPLCGIEAASAHTRCVNGFQEALGQIALFPQDLVHHEDGERPRCWVEGLDELVEDCYLHAALPSERGVPWAKKGRVLDLTEYNSFPS